MDNQSIIKYSWETLPKKWVHKMERSEHGNRSNTNTDYPFQLLCFLKFHTYTQVQVSINICRVDHPSRKRRFEVVHNLLSTQYNSRIPCTNKCRRSNTNISGSQSISISWLVGARSMGYVWCFFHQSSGSMPYINRLWFRGSSITKRLSFEWICGSTHYDDPEKHVVSEPIEMTQEFRYFDYASPWEQHSDR